MQAIQETLELVPPADAGVVTENVGGRAALLRIRHLGVEQAARSLENSRITTVAKRSTSRGRFSRGL
jgi:hypothetical protein